MTDSEAAEILIKIETVAKQGVASQLVAPLIGALKDAFGEGRASIHTPERMLEMQRVEAQLAAHKDINKQLVEIIGAALTRV